MQRYAVAARRARLLAEILRVRPLPLEHRETLGMIVAHLETAAARLYGYPAPATAEPNGIPRNLREDVEALRELLATIPAGLSASILGYVTAPLTGEPVTVAPQGHGSRNLAQQERRTTESIASLVARLDDPRDDLVRTYFDALLTLHNRHDRLARLARLAPASPAPIEETPAPVAEEAPVERPDTYRGVPVPGWIADSWDTLSATAWREAVDATLATVALGG
ncbi:hypothetical protein ACFU6S_32665 [Streptomyces sp. NPDC057456]|uniref:hypothetical protein n=1 Tax=Streptomyces sp. NPDC057456 TaxID=3346139 RepID=UPI0036ACDD15